MKPGTFIMGGVNSESMKTYIQDRPLLQAPQRKVKFQNAYGSDGDIPFDEEAYENTELKLILVTDGASREELFNVLDTRGTYVDLIPYFDPEKIYKVMLTNKTEFESKWFYGGAFATSVEFSVKPYKQLVDNLVTQIGSGDYTIGNPTNYYSQPIIDIQATSGSDITVKTNGVEFKIRDVPNRFIVDSLRFNVYERVSASVLRPMNDKVFSREYPIFNPGNNTIAISGGIVSASINCGWRSLV